MVDISDNGSCYIQLSNQFWNKSPENDNMNNYNYNYCTPQIQASLSGPDLESHAGLAMACYLLKNGADPHSKNQQNKSALQLVSSQTVLDVLSKFTLPQYLG